MLCFIYLDLSFCGSWSELYTNRISWRRSCSNNNDDQGQVCLWSNTFNFSLFFTKPYSIPPELHITCSEKEEFFCIRRTSGWVNDDSIFFFFFWWAMPLSVKAEYVSEYSAPWPLDSSWHELSLCWRFAAALWYIDTLFQLTVFKTFWLSHVLHPF